MAKVKKTKTALKQQRDSLGRFQRYLPTLELKKQQLRMEVSRLEHAIEQNGTEREEAHAQLDHWVRLFAEPIDLNAMLRLDVLETDRQNIAGISVPIFHAARFVRQNVDLFTTPLWVDKGLAMLEQMLQLEAQRRILYQARDLLAEELRITSQRVNLFEKVKIPTCRENIRVIKIALGDAQTAGVARAKRCKGSSLETERATE